MPATPVDEGQQPSRVSRVLRDVKVMVRAPISRFIHLCWMLSMWNAQVKKDLPILLEPQTVSGIIDALHDPNAIDDRKMLVRSRIPISPYLLPYPMLTHWVILIPFILGIRNT